MHPDDCNNGYGDYSPPDQIDLGGTLTTFLADGQPIRLDIIDWQMWHARWKQPEGADAFAFLEAVVARVKAVADVEVSPRIAAALIDAIRLETERLRLFTEAQLSTLRSTAST